MTSTSPPWSSGNSRLIHPLHLFLLVHRGRVEFFVASCSTDVAWRNIWRCSRVLLSFTRDNALHGHFLKTMYGLYGFRLPLPGMYGL
jgi:hypothetical protein